MTKYKKKGRPFKSSLKQLWSHERKWNVHGSLASMAARLEQMSKYKSVTPYEADRMHGLAVLIGEDIKAIKSKERDRESWRLYKERKNE